MGTAFLRDSNLHCVNTLCFGSTKTAPKGKGAGRWSAWPEYDDRPESEQGLAGQMMMKIVLQQIFF
jgi:hypothetical protein